MKCPAINCYLAHATVGAIIWLLAGAILPFLLFRGVEGGHELDFAYMLNTGGLTLPGGVIVGLALAYILRGRPDNEHTQPVGTPFGMIKTHGDSRVFDFGLVISTVVAFLWTFLVAQLAADPLIVVPRPVWAQTRDRDFIPCVCLDPSFSIRMQNT